VWLPTTAAAPTAFSVERPRAPAGARVLRSAGSSLRVAVAMAGEGCETGEFGKERGGGRKGKGREGKGAFSSD
jgi:hypothetical protein